MLLRRVQSCGAAGAVITTVRGDCRLHPNGNPCGRVGAVSAPTSAPRAPRPGRSAGLCACGSDEEGAGARRGGRVDRLASRLRAHSAAGGIEAQGRQVEDPAGPDVRPADHGRVDQLLAGTADAGRQAPGALLATLVPALRRDGELDLSDEEAALLVAMSAATIDRRLAGERAKLIPRGRPHTKAGSLLKSQTPVRIWGAMGRRVPGFVRSTWSATRAATPPGSTIFTLTVADIATGWTVNRSVRKAAKWVFEALEHVLAVFPFPIIGIDSDNGSELINDHLCGYRIEQKITSTRPRPGDSNEGSHVEQKNWARVGELVGYHRYDIAGTACSTRSGSSTGSSPTTTCPSRS